MRKTILSFMISFMLLTGLAYLIFHLIISIYPIYDFSYLETEPSNEVKFNNYSDYTSFLKSQENLPANFVTAEMLKCFGTFEQFYCEDEATIGGYDGYSYVLKVEGYSSISIFIHHKSVEHSLKPIDKSAISTENMAKINSKEGSVIVCDEGIEYRYLYGSLDAIVWTIGDVQIKLRTSTGGVTYFDFPKDHILGKALSKDPKDQLSVYNQLTAMFNSTSE